MVTSGEELSFFDTESIMGTVTLVNFVKCRNFNLFFLGRARHFGKAIFEADANLDRVREFELGTKNGL